MEKIRVFFKDSWKNELIIGTDSHAYNSYTVFTTAIVAHRLGKGATYFYKTHISKEYYELRSRIFKEAQLSIDTANLVLKMLANEDFQKILRIEIHVDIGEKGPTKELIKSITGFISGSGFDVKIKPDSYAATKVADRHTLHKK